MFLKIKYIFLAFLFFFTLLELSAKEIDDPIFYKAAIEKNYLTVDKKLVNKKDYTEVRKWLIRIYHSGYEGSAYYVGRVLRREQSFSEAIKWFKKGADIGDNRAIFYIGYSYEKDFKNLKLALDWYLKAYKKGVVNGVDNIADIYSKLREYEKSIKWYKTAIKLGYKKYAFDIAVLYDKKLQNTKEAIYWYEKSYELKQEKSAEKLAIIYYKKKELEKSKEWWIKSSMMGNVKASYNLAVLYKREQDYINSIKYYEKAYALGYTNAAYKLATLYHLTLRNIDKANEWYAKVK